MSKIRSLVGFLLLCLAIEVVSGWATSLSVQDWYPLLKKPSWTPPPWVFGPVWTILYVMIAISGWLIYHSHPSHFRSAALRYYFIQLFLNFSWSFSFFTFQQPLLGLLNICLLWIFIGLTIIYSWKVNRIASLLLILYFAWVSYAVTLNAGIWWLL